MKLFLSALLSFLVFCPNVKAEFDDPLEPVNRKIFWFNEKFDMYVLGPVARGWGDVTTPQVRQSTRNFFRNVKTPSYLISDLIQLKFEQLGVHSLRFLINTTAGVVGLFDVAGEFGMPYHDEDFGSALGYWGVPEGPYIVIPFIGSSNVRDVFGLVGDTLANPVTYANNFVNPNSAGLEISYGLTALEVVSARYRLEEGIKTGRESSLDYYLFVQSAFHQIRQNLIYDNNPPDEYQEDDSVK